MDGFYQRLRMTPCCGPVASIIVPLRSCALPGPALMSGRRYCSVVGHRVAGWECWWLCPRAFSLVRRFVCCRCIRSRRCAKSISRFSSASVGAGGMRFSPSYLSLLSPAAGLDVGLVATSCPVSWRRPSCVADDTVGGQHRFHGRRFLPSGLVSAALRTVGGRAPSGLASSAVPPSQEMPNLTGAYGARPRYHPR